MSRTPGASLTLPVLSGSMSPYLRPGGNVFVECVPADSCQLGDIIVFRESDRLVAHRLLFRLRLGRSLFLYQKGDAARFGHWVQKGEFVGIVTRSQDVDGTQLYRRVRRPRNAGRVVCRHLYRDVRARIKAAIQLLRRFPG